MKPTVSDSRNAPPSGNSIRRNRRVERREQHVLCEHARSGKRVEQCRFSGVRVADKGNDLLIGRLPVLPVQASRPLYHCKLASDRIDAFADGTPVGLDLSFAGTAKKAETAPLALKVRPRPDKPAFLIGETRQFNLQPALFAARAVGEDLKNEPRAVENLRVPCLFEIALLDGADHVVHDRNRDILGLDDRREFLDLSRAEKCCGPGLS